MTDCWDAVRYQKGDQQTIHNHRSWGFTGILYVDFDPKVHTPTCFVAPWQDPRSDTITLAYPKDVKKERSLSPRHIHYISYIQIK